MFRPAQYAICAGGTAYIESHSPTNTSGERVGLLPVSLMKSHYLNCTFVCQACQPSPPSPNRAAAVCTPRVITNAANQPVWRWDSAQFSDTLANAQPTGGVERCVLEHEKAHLPDTSCKEDCGVHLAVTEDKIYLSAWPIRGLSAYSTLSGYVALMIAVRSSVEKLDVSKDLLISSMVAVLFSLDAFVRRSCDFYHS
jgi:hypothetical protein